MTFAQGLGLTMLGMFMMLFSVLCTLFFNTDFGTSVIFILLGMALALCGFFYGVFSKDIPTMYFFTCYRCGDPFHTVAEADDLCDSCNELENKVK